MSAPVQEPDGGSSKGGPSSHGPQKARHRERDPNPAGPPLKGDAASKGAVSESAEPPWRRSRQREPFVGDVAMTQLRSQLALAPDRLPGPPPPPSTGPKYALAGRLAGVIVVAAVGVVGYRLGSTPPASAPQLAPRSGQANQEASASERNIPAAYPLQTAAPPFAPSAGTKAIAPQSNEQKSRDAALPRAVSRQLTVGAVRPQQADEAARLAVSAADADANAAVVIGGLASGSTLSAGRQVAPTTWRLSVEELAGAAIMPPQGFVGTMALTLELHLADDSVVDRKGLQLEWSAKSVLAPTTSQPRQHDAAEIAAMLKSGAEFMANGEVAAARMLYQRAAESREPAAAFALAETYDPLVLGKLNVKGGISPDVALAHRWYEKAKELGSAAAPERLERLARSLK